MRPEPRHRAQDGLSHPTITQTKQTQKRMLQRDYFIRIIEEFMAAVSRFLEKKEDAEHRQRELADLYRQYVGDMSLLRNMTVDEALNYANDQYKPSERIERLQMLAYLLSAEGQTTSGPMRLMLLEKAYSLFDYVDAHDNTFSLPRKQQLAKLNSELKAGESGTK